MKQLALAVSFALLVLGCSKQEQLREVDWAKAALARNPALEILSTDEVAGTFEVRDTVTGAVSRLKLEDLVAGPAPSRVAAQTPAAAAPAAPAPAAPGPEVPNAALPEEAAAPAHQTTETVAAIPPSEGHTLAEGPGYTIARGEATPKAEAPAYLEGPGYRITRDEPIKEPSEHQSGASAESVATEKRTDPIICQGDRLMRIDGETLAFEGDAVIAENGCDLYISNVHIRAGGIGIIARQARVHIVNSTIGGSKASYEASQGAEIYVAQSTFAGVGRRFDDATMNDLGGNQYELIH
jgi:hypothetical protein